MRGASPNRERRRKPSAFFMGDAPHNRAMSTIDIRRIHGTTLKKAKASAQAIADELAGEFDVEYEWEGHVLHFRQIGRAHV